MNNNFGKINALVIIIIVLVQLLISVCIYFFLLRSSGEEQPQRLSTLQQTEVYQPPRNEEPRHSENRSFSGGSSYGAKDYTRDFAIFNLGQSIVNPSGVDRLFITTVLFEYRQTDRRLPAELQNKAPMMKDRVAGYFSRLSLEDLRDVENRDIFRDDIMRIINNLLVDGRITDVFFEEFIIQ